LNLEITFLGVNGALFANERHLSAQHVRHGKTVFLVDCGEGTQLQLQRYGISFESITHIFISHLHGDHYFGLTGLISSMHLLRREKPLVIYGPVGLSEIITTQFKYSKTALQFPIDLVELNEHASIEIFDNENLTIRTIPLKHKLYCNGLIFREKPKAPRLDKQKLPPDITIEEIKRLKAGKDVSRAGKIVYRNDEFTLPPRKSFSYAYCSDTAFYEPIVGMIENVDLLYHEATFMNKESEKARATLHSTAREAATIAKLAKADKLVIGHFSQRYDDLNKLLEEACEVFSKTFLAKEGQTWKLKEN
jgi:ribonuclease Z